MRLFRVKHFGSQTEHYQQIIKKPLHKCHRWKYRLSYGGADADYNKCELFFQPECNFMTISSSLAHLHFFA